MPLGRLAEGLRNARLRADLTYRQLADRAPGFSRPTLQNAASGRTLPTREAVTTHAKACDTEPGPLLKLREEAVQVWRPAHSAAPATKRIRDEAGLAAALYNLRLNAGNPSCREVEKRTRTSPGSIRVPRTTVHRVLYRQRFPSSRTQLKAILVALGVPASDHAERLPAWTRANRRRQANGQDQEGQAPPPDHPPPDAPARRQRPEAAGHPRQPSPPLP
ncbi:helix-turn-helix domain-containing protein [Streptomyces vinaceus]|uniref:helix-turn-helix domain-containing protein n=1 Tax=Streptomyces vinaceus TaxID=1960 RepID=UPI00142F0D80|nr:hypothetical protein GCM10017778_31780 [Streptomyces vinaceus]